MNFNISPSQAYMIHAALTVFIEQSETHIFHENYISSNDQHTSDLLELYALNEQAKLMQQEIKSVLIKNQ